MRTELKQNIDDLVSRLRRRQVCGAFSVALHTSVLLREFISFSTFDSYPQLIDLVRALGARLVVAQPLELSSGNIIRRFLHTVRCDSSMERPSHSMFTLLDDGSASLPPSQAVSRRSSFDGAEQLSLDKQKRHHAIASMAHEIVDGIINDLTDTQKNISRQALQHIHMNEVLMTYGASPTCEAFFLEAARKRTFQVLIADSTFSAESQETAKRLSEKDINTTLVYDTSIFALMARVNKVVISAHAVLANGGIIAQAGTNLLLQAAHHYSTPVVVLAGLYNLSPLYSFHPQIQNILLNASDVANYEDDLHPDVQNLNPQFDYVPPEMINLFVTNDGDHSPSYVYRLLAEQYDFQDYSL